MARDWSRVFAKQLTKTAAASAAPAPAAVAAAAATVAAPPAAPASVASAPAEGPPPTRWEEELAAFADQDRESPPEAGGVVLLGSSNIRLWTTLADDFPGMNVVNRGVGGCRLEELAEFAPRLLAAAKPRVIVVSAGTNDIAAGATAASVRESFERLVAAVRRDHPEATLVYLAISPTAKRWDQFPRQCEANAAIKAAIDEQAVDGDLVYLDANAAFLGPDGLPAAECFLDDMQHPSTIGNARRADLIRPVLRALVDGR
jgi:lysophospholipase L1-like esterase